MDTSSGEVSKHVCLLAAQAEGHTEVHHLMNTKFQNSTLHSNMDNIPYDDRIELAISDLKSQSRLNFSKIVREYNVDRVTFIRRYRGETGSRQDAISNFCKALINA